MRNKRFLSFSALTAAFSLFLSGCAGSQEASVQEHTAELFAMGTYMNFTAYGEQADAALDEAVSHVEEWESLWSVTD